MSPDNTTAYASDVDDPEACREYAAHWFDRRDGWPCGHFIGALFDLCAISDTAHRARLRQAFPVAVDAWNARREGGRA